MEILFFFHFFEVIILPSFLVIFILLTCTKPRKTKTESNSGNNPKHRRIERQQKTLTPSNTTKTKTENTRDRGSAPTISGTPQVQNEQTGETSKLNKKSIKSPKPSHRNNNNKTSKRSKREKSKEEKTKKESNLKKFLHKFGGGNSEKKNTTKTRSFEEAPPEGQNDENEKVPYSSRKARRRKMIGDNLKTAEDGDVTNTQAEEEAKIIDPVKVNNMGNIDIITQQEKNKRIREIEQMPSGNYCEEATQLSKSIKKENMHVKIVETNCKLYETNAEPMTRSLKESLRKRKKIKHHLRPRSRGSDSK